MSKKYFGSDGIRGRLGKTCITPEFMFKLGWIIKTTLEDKKNANRVLIGKDTRISGYMLESALEAGFLSAGIDILLAGPLPSPAVAHLTKSLNCRAGIMLTASHNSYEDAGIKLFDAQGMKLSNEQELEIEAEIDRWLDKKPPQRSSDKLGKAYRVEGAAERYLEFCKSTFTAVGTGLTDAHVVLDCANGAAYKIAPNLFTELGASVEALAVHPNGYNINKDCGANDTSALAQRVVASNADLGVALDGDADRVVLVDDRGQVMDGDDLLFILARHYQNTGQLKAGVVGTVMANTGLERTLESMHIPFARTAVGDKHVAERLRACDWNLGGESSGHILCSDLTSSCDAIVAGLQVIQAWLGSRRSLHEFRQGMQRTPQVLINLPHRSHVGTYVMPDKLGAVIENIRLELKGSGRVLVRSSGTEAVMRIMIEAENQEQIACAQAEIFAVAKA